MEATLKFLSGFPFWVPEWLTVDPGFSFLSPAQRLNRPRRRRVCSILLTLEGNHCFYEPTAVNERLRPCFTLSIADRPYKLESRGVRIGPAHQIAVEFDNLSRTERTVLRQITVSPARKPWAWRCCNRTSGSAVSGYRTNPNSRSGGMVTHRALSSRVCTGLSGWSPASSTPSTTSASYA